MLIKPSDGIKKIFTHNKSGKYGMYDIYWDSLSHCIWILTLNENFNFQTPVIETCFLIKLLFRFWNLLCGTV